MCVYFPLLDFHPDKQESRNKIRLSTLFMFVLSAVCIYAGAGNALLFVLIHVASCAYVYACMRVWVLWIRTQPFYWLNLGTQSHSNLTSIRLLLSAASNKKYACPCGERWDNPSAERIRYYQQNCGNLPTKNVLFHYTFSYFKGRSSQFIFWRQRCLAYLLIMALYGFLKKKV